MWNSLFCSLSLSFLSWTWTKWNRRGVFYMRRYFTVRWRRFCFDTILSKTTSIVSFVMFGSTIICNMNIICVWIWLSWPPNVFTQKKKYHIWSVVACQQFFHFFSSSSHCQLSCPITTQWCLYYSLDRRWIVVYICLLLLHAAIHQ